MISHCAPAATEGVFFLRKRHIPKLASISAAPKKKQRIQFSNRNRNLMKATDHIMWAGFNCNVRQRSTSRQMFKKRTVQTVRVSFL